MLRILICYRREDSAPYAGRLYDSLHRQFGSNVFMDIDSIDPGEDFHDAIQRVLERCDVLIAVIGSAWLGITDVEGRRRIENPDDFVRLEIAAALDRGVKVIPVLVSGSRMPGAEEIPEPIRGLARRQAIEISDTRFGYDVGRLIQALGKLQKVSQQRSSGPFSNRRRLLASLAVVTVCVGLALSWRPLLRRVVMPRPGHEPSLPSTDVPRELPAPAPALKATRAKTESQGLSSNSSNTERSISNATPLLAPPEGKILVYATSAGGVADDGPSERNGLFTKHLLAVLRKPNIEFSAALGEVRERVLEESGHSQEPWVNMSYSGAFYIFPVRDRALRTALVIGNRDYGGRRGLQNPIHDATDMASLLNAAGFTTDIVLDANQQSMTAALSRLSGPRTRGLEVKHDVVLFFYSGHAVAVKGENYLIPIDFPEALSESDVRSKALAEAEILGKLSQRGAELTVCIFDTCRDNPLSSLR